MDCRTFRKLHVAYLDDTLPAVLLVQAERHVRECGTCAAHDTSVRRSLLLARNLPTLEVSDDFAERLARRIDDVRCGRCDVPDDAVPFDWAPSRAELLRAAFSGAATRRRVAAVAAGLLALTYAGGQVFGRGDGGDVELPPVVASVPEPLPVVVPSALLRQRRTVSAVIHISWPPIPTARSAPPSSLARSTRCTCSTATTTTARTAR
jgi:hypothetical protein